MNKLKLGDTVYFIERDAYAEQGLFSMRKEKIKSIIVRYDGNEIRHTEVELEFFDDIMPAESLFLTEMDAVDDAIKCLHAIKNSINK